MSVILEQKKGFEQGYEYGYGSTELVIQIWMEKEN